MLGLSQDYIKLIMFTKFDWNKLKQNFELQIINFKLIYSYK